MNYPKHRAGWTDERIEKLKQLHKAGYSASQIAAFLGGITRNAAIGKCSRLGLGPIGGGKASAPMRAKEFQGTLQRRPKPARQPSRKGVMVLPEMKGGDVATSARIENMAARANPAANVRLMSREFTPLEGRDPVPFGSPGCKWPVSLDSGADMMCCGADRVEATAARPSPPYCPAHAAAAFKPVPKAQGHLRPAFHNTSKKKAWAA